MDNTKNTLEAEKVPLSVEFIDKHLQEFQIFTDLFRDLGWKHPRVHLSQPDSDHLILTVRDDVDNSCACKETLTRCASNEQKRVFRFMAGADCVLSSDENAKETCSSFAEKVREFVFSNLVAKVQGRMDKDHLWNVNLFEDKGLDSCMIRQYILQFANFYQEKTDGDILSAWENYVAEEMKELKRERVDESIDQMEKDEDFSDYAFWVPMETLSKEVISEIVRNGDWKVDIGPDTKYGPIAFVDLFVDSGNWEYGRGCDRLPESDSDLRSDRFEKSSALWLAKQIGKEKEWRDLIEHVAKGGYHAAFDNLPEDTPLNEILADLLCDAHYHLKGSGTLTFLLALPVGTAFRMIAAQQKKEYTGDMASVVIPLGTPYGFGDPVPANDDAAYLRRELEQELTLPLDHFRIYMESILPGGSMRTEDYDTADALYRPAVKNKKKQ